VRDTVRVRPTSRRGTGVRGHGRGRFSARGRLRPALAAALLLLGTGGAAAGCSTESGESGGGSGEDSGRGSGGSEDTLVRQWKVDLGKDETDASSVGWVTGDTVVLDVGGGGLRGFDTRTGRTRWALKPPAGKDGICNHAPAANRAGTGVVAYGEGAHGTHCDTVTAVDTRTGHKLWTRKLPHELPSDGLDVSAGQALTVGERAVATASDIKGEVRRFAAGSGKPLRPVHGYRVRSHDTAKVVGRRVAVLTSGSGEHADERELAAYDVDSGKRLWKRREPELDGKDRMNAVSDDPLTVGVASSPGDGSGLRSYDGHGKTLHEFGVDDQFRQVFTAGRRHGRALVGQFSGASGLTGEEPVYALDPRSGKQLWRLVEPRLRPVGVSGDRFFGVLRRQRTGSGGDPEVVHRLMSASLDDGRLTHRGAVPPVHGGKHGGHGGGHGDESVVGAAADTERLYLVQRPGLDYDDDHLYLTAYAQP